MSGATESANQQFRRAALLWLKAILQDGATPRSVLDIVVPADSMPPFLRLVRKLDLTPFEADVLMVAAALELDPAAGDFVATANGDPHKRLLTPALALARLASPTWDAFSPARPLRALRLLEPAGAAADFSLHAPLRINERVGAAIKGLGYLEESLAAMTRRLPAQPELPPSQEIIAAALGGWLADDSARGIVQLSGAFPEPKADVVARAAALSGRVALELSADWLLATTESLDALTRLWSREAALGSLLLWIRGVDSPDGESGTGSRAGFARLDHFLQRVDAPLLLDVRQPVPALCGTPAFAVEPPRPEERALLWQAVLGLDREAPRTAPERLAGEYQLGVSQIASIAALARGANNDAERCTRAWRVCRQQTAAPLSGIARLIEPRVPLSQIKLPPAEREQLERIVAHARQRARVCNEFGFAARSSRGLGLTALFHGESGTGKTLGAEGVAHALDLSLAVVDLATIKNKYIGETEKNLRRVFDAAETGGCVLFFDEADALFGKRSEVKDSHDRYANVEINYLLSRMESFTGVAILATNMKHALDPAFIRRLRFIVGFPFPGVDERKEIWRAVFPAAAPVDVLDYDRLARVPLTGGNIFSAALAAAHAAAHDGLPVRMDHALNAIRWELRKLDRPAGDPAALSPSTPRPMGARG